MTSNDEDYVYDEESGEWISAADARAKAGTSQEADTVEVRDAVGNLLPYIGAIVAGTIVTAVMLMLLKKPIVDGPAVAA